MKNYMESVISNVQLKVIPPFGKECLFKYVEECVKSKLSFLHRSRFQPLGMDSREILRAIVFCRQSFLNNNHTFYLAEFVSDEMI